MRMDPLRKASPGAGRRSATVLAVGRRVARAGAVFLVLLAGLASALYAARPSAGGTDTITGATSVSTTTVSTLPSVLVVSGHGYGHGLGMSQWGAYGYALHGFAYDRILQHYFPGTTLQHAPGRTLRVLVAEARTVTVGSNGPWSVTDASGTRVPLDPGTVELGAALTLDSHPELSPPFSFTSPTPLTVGGIAYRGKLVASSDGKLVSVVNDVGLEWYLKGVVPAEMPPAWPAAALQAQAVAARSYALANIAKSGPFDLYGDSRSQVYAGASAETAATSAAVAATAGQVLEFGGRVADALFHSSSGGRTVSSLEATGVAVPYLVSVADPYDTLSPLHDWGPILLDAAKVAKTLALTAPISALTVTDGPSGRVKTLELVTADEATSSFTGNELRVALGLNSTWFQPVLLRLQPSVRTVAYGAPVTLGGSGAPGVALEARPSGSSDWAAAGSPAPAPDGSFTLLVRPRVTTSYRLALGAVRAALVTVAVAARVSAVAAGSGISGTAKPAAAGATVQLLERSASGWSPVSSTTTDASGAFSFGGKPAPGIYRVRVSPGHGVSPGVSATLPVQ